MSWPTNTIKIEGYPGWEFTYMDLSVQEVEEFGDAIEEGSAVKSLHIILPAIKSWTFTDRNGDDIPITKEGLGLLPMPVVMKMYQGVLGTINQSSGPKVENTTES